MCQLPSVFGACNPNLGAPMTILKMTLELQLARRTIFDLPPSESQEATFQLRAPLVYYPYSVSSPAGRPILPCSLSPYPYSTERAEVDSRRRTQLPDAPVWRVCICCWWPARLRMPLSRIVHGPTHFEFVGLSLAKRLLRLRQPARRLGYLFEQERWHKR